MDPIFNGTETNLTNQTADGYVSYEVRPETYILPILFFIIFVIGTLGNGTLIRIFIKHRNMRTVPNTYIFSLALGDLLVILTSVPFTSTVFTVESWPYGSLLCKSAKDVSVGVSVFTLTALSANRFFAIVDPLKRYHSGGYRNGATAFTIVIVTIIWIISILLATPAAMFSFLKEIQITKERSIQVCYPFPDELGAWYPKTVVMTRFIVYYALPLFIIAFFYILMARHLVLSTHNLPGESGRQARARKKVAKMVSAFVFIFALCFLPHHVYMLWFHNNPNFNRDYNAFWHALKIVGFSLGYINSCINPIALFCVSGTFRKYFYKYLFCCCKRSSMERSHSMSLTSTKRMGTLTTSMSKKSDRNHGHSKQKHAFLPEVTITTFMNGVNDTEDTPKMNLI
ncbi:hypothetical protein RUM43_003377 [Polyplax serrata]|uniref:G-protein coupled receptors family 1 profile domain-containing protein n=1 Tax=Polyplax serrata TaxID=468196 RepID=A0AAN8P366_POLSC